MDISKSATLSPCRTYRYNLWRKWADQIPGSRGYAMFIGLNPSTADETVDDPTIRRCINFAQSWGYEALCMTNLFAFRATQPNDMKAAPDPIGPENDATLLELATTAGVVVAAWGVHGSYLGRDNSVKAMIQKLRYLQLTRAGKPGHPLYLPATLKPVPWIA